MGKQQPFTVFAIDEGQPVPVRFLSQTPKPTLLNLDKFELQEAVQRLPDLVPGYASFLKVAVGDDQVTIFVTSVADLFAQDNATCKGDPLRASRGPSRLWC